MNGVTPVPGPTIITGRRWSDGRVNGFFNRANKGTIGCNGNGLEVDTESSQPEQIPNL